MSITYKTDKTDAIYFVTCACIGWVNVFTKPVYKEIFVDNLNYCIKNKELEVFAYVLMTNHFHLLARSKSDKVTVSEILRDFKKHTSKLIRKEIENNDTESRKEWMLTVFKIAGTDNPNNKDFQFWRQDNHPLEIYTQKFIEQKLNYIHENPVRDGTVDEPHHYIYSSARDYMGIKGKVEITLIG